MEPNAANQAEIERERRAEDARDATDKVAAALAQVSDDIADLDSFAETFDEEDWGEPGRFGPAVQAETDRALRTLSEVADHARRIVFDAQAQRAGRSAGFDEAQAIESLADLFGISLDVEE